LPGPIHISERKGRDDRVEMFLPWVFAADRVGAKWESLPGLLAAAGECRDDSSSRGRKTLTLLRIS
jgi:hypothetical protein